MVREKVPSIIFLMETNCSQVQMERIRGKIGAKHYFAVSSLMERGGLVVPWYEGVTLELINFFNYHINTRVKFGFAGTKCLLTGFYGIPKTLKRVNSWHLLGRIN